MAGMEVVTSGGITQTAADARYLKSASPAVLSGSISVPTNFGIADGDASGIRYVQGVGPEFSDGNSGGAIRINVQSVTSGQTRVLTAPNASGALALAATKAFSSTTTGNTAATETDIRTTTLAAALLATDGDSVHFTAAGSFAATASVNKRIIVYFGGTAIFDSGNLAITSASTWRLSADVFRVGATAVKCTTIVSSSAAGALTALSQYLSVTGLTLANTQVFKITGNGTNASDVVAEVSEIEWRSAA